MTGLSKRTDFSHLQVRYLFHFQSTCTICSHNAGTVTSVSAMFHAQGRFCQDAVNRRDCHSVSDSLDVQFACFSRLDTFLGDEWSADVRMVWGVTNLQWILLRLCETLLLTNMHFWTWHFLHFPKGAELAKWKRVLLTIMYLFCQKKSKKQAFILHLSIGNCPSYLWIGYNWKISFLTATTLSLPSPLFFVFRYS